MNTNQLKVNPWDDDFKNHPETEYKFEYNGYQCELRKHPLFSNWNGYVTLPKTHPFYHKKYNNISDKIDVHGQLTYSRLGTFGFDTAHTLTDILPGDSIYNIQSFFHDVDDINHKHYWTFDEVVEETKRMVDQFIFYEK